MKTPRQIILERHRPAETRLKDISEHELAALARESAMEKPDATQARPQSSALLRQALAGFWREAVWPWHRVWAGLAAVWIAIMALSLAGGELPRVHGGEMKLTPNPQIIAELREQRKLLTQLLEPTEASAPAPSKASGPRGELRHELFIV